jgi:AcrR family transcriptional regulator
MTKPERRPYSPRMAPADRREQLLDAALALIADEGYGAVSIEAIARRADVTRPVVYHLFDGLDALLSALLDRQERRALAQLLGTLTAAPDLSDLDAFARRAVLSLAAIVTADPLTWRPILLAGPGTPAAVRVRIDRDRALARARIQALLELTPLAPGADAGVAAHALIAIAEHFGRLLLETPEAVDHERLAATVVALVAGLRARPA